MRNLSKSKILAFRQCPRRLWLEIHHPELRVDSAATQARIAGGHEVGAVAQKLYDPGQHGVLLDAQRDGYAETFARTQELLRSGQPIFEAGFTIKGALAFADILLPTACARHKSWRMIEVKSSTSVKDYHRDDIAFQSYVARSAGLPLSSVAVAHVDNSWVYPGNGDYRGLLVEADLTQEAIARENEVKDWITQAHAVAAREKEPVCRTGKQCGDPFECGFLTHCRSKETQAQVPATWLPRIQKKALRGFISDQTAVEMRDVPNDFLNDKQLRVKRHSLAGTTYFDAPGAAADLSGTEFPAYFLDFETILLAVPRWTGTHPYEQIPFQFSIHRMEASGEISASAFLDLTGEDPSRPFAEALVDACGKRGSVFVYNAGFEKTRISELAVRLPELSRALRAINERIVDLLPIAEDRYYHPDQHGSWSIKAVLPTIAPDLRYDQLNGVQDGGMAMGAYLEATHPATTDERKTEIAEQLRAYCNLDTLAMVRLWQFFIGRNPT